ncbi:hypothetical protein N9Z73_00160 [bacterium]|nr:hypothetical protein [bacterium]
MYRIDLDKLVKIQEISQCDVEVGAEDYCIALRFGYWKELYFEQIVEINEVLGHCFELVLDWEDHDDDCGRKVSYKIVNR